MRTCFIPFSQALELREQVANWKKATLASTTVAFTGGSGGGGGGGSGSGGSDDQNDMSGDKRDNQTVSDIIAEYDDIFTRPELPTLKLKYVLTYCIVVLKCELPKSWNIFQFLRLL